MNGIQTIAYTDLFSLASSRLKLYKGLLSSYRLLLIGLQKEKLNNVGILIEKQRICIDKIKQIDNTYVIELKKLNNQELASAFLSGTPYCEKYPEFCSFFSLLEEQCNTIEKISLLNKEAVLITKQLSADCKSRLSSIRQQSSIRKNYYAGYAQRLGSILNYSS